MIAICCATTDERTFAAGAAHTVRALDEVDSPLLRRHRCGSAEGPYNEMLAAAAARDDLEAVVFVHEGAVVDARVEVMARIRALLEASEHVAAIGAADGVRAREVATADGTLLALSAWAARNLRFDPALAADADASAQDISLRARAEGRRVLAAPLGVVRALPGRVGRAERQGQLDAMVELRRKWEDEALARA